MSDPAVDREPPPTAGQTDVLPLVLDDLRRRSDEGLKKYGTRLQVENDRDHLIDAYQEALDLVMYLRAELAERKAAHVQLAELENRLEDRTTTARFWIREGVRAEFRANELEAVVRDLTRRLERAHQEIETWRTAYDRRVRLTRYVDAQLETNPLIKLARELFP